MKRANWKPPTSIEGVTFHEIYELFANSRYGETLRQAIRYAPYKPEEVSNEKWVEVLGPDVSNLEHLNFTLSLTQSFLRLSANPHKEWGPRERGLEGVKFDRSEEELLCLTAIIHDWGEAVVGDIPYNEKNSQHEEEEFKVLNRLIEEICDKKYEKLITDMRIAASIALNEKDTKLSRAFSAIEHVGYGTTALKAWKEWKNFDGALSRSLLKLASEVTKPHLPIWQKHASVYPGVHYFLLQNKKTLKEIQDADIDWRDVPILANN